MKSGKRIAGTFLVGAWIAVFIVCFNISTAISQVINIPDAVGDVGIPVDATIPTPPAGTISGWDMQLVRLTYNPSTDVMSVFMDFDGIGGDADDDGDPGGTSAWLAVRGGTDHANLSGPEALCIGFDSNNDFQAEFVVGVSNSTGMDFSNFAVHNCNGAALYSPQTSVLWGSKIADITDAAWSSGDLSFTIPNFSTLPGFTFTPGESFSVRLMAFAGSDDDDGIGEDKVPNSPGVVNFFADYGDAPAPYPTLIANNGAYHVIHYSLTLGASIDGEADGQPNSNATGDDTDGNDDEDGVTFLNSLVRSQQATVRVNASAAGKLDAWIDFNDDGDWADAGEKIFDNTAVSAGNNDLTFTVPATATVTAQTFSRFRLSSAGGLSYTGKGNDGEVEDYQVEIRDYLDFGDAPETNYPTTLANNGPRHQIQSGVMLGSNIDNEFDGQPNSGATGDDIAGIDDEDGVSFPSGLVQGANSGINVTASVAGYLHGWIDWNDDGDWDDAGEKVFNNQALSAGVNNLSVSVPWGAQLGQTFSRFRFVTASTPGMAYTGLASTGEVEDYTVTISEQIDFGDAPDPTYPTLLASSSARHRMDGSHFLGSSVDSESDGQPNAGATGDDTDGNDDEDGVTFTSQLVPALTTTLNVNANAAGLLSGWIDFNRDGDWNDTGEKIFNDESLTAGVNSLSFGVPYNSQSGDTYARFRFSTNSGLSTTGYTNNGEVEDYLVTIQPGRDYGDAPETNYPTLLASSGAYHTISSGFYLGASIDSEADGQPTVGADGDDTHGIDDEDGVVFNTTLRPYQSASITVTASAAGQLDGWIDFNDDGDWNDAGEMIFDDYVLSAGSNPLNVTVPGTATVTSQTYARFRFSSAGGLGVTGGASDGEVEDYTIGISAAQDFGDAPSTYPVLLVNNGARHNLGFGLRFGASVDGDPDGQPTTGATGDDTDGNDDEDGVSFNTSLVQYQQAQITVNASGEGRLDAWIDYNDDGDWNDSGEKIFNNLVLSAGNNVLNFTVPGTATVTSQTYSRFRISSTGGLSPSGQANDGEVEDYEVEIEVAQDFGDAPDPTYPVLLASNGARHTIVSGFRLGGSIDGEADGQPSAGATGDDTNGTDDEDGVTLPSSIVPGTTAYVTVNASSAGKLDAWIDFNDDGDWGDANEKIFNDLDIVAGNNNLSFSVPFAASSPSATFSRFRFSSAGGLGITGLAVDGEVEDYTVNIETASPSIHIEKATEGQDADLPTGPFIPVTNTVHWTYTVTNTGNVPLASVVVTDDNGTPGVPGDNFNPTYLSGDANGNHLLDTYETWNYQAQGVATAGQYENYASVVGYFNSVPYTDNDPSHYFGYYTGIHIEKSTNGQDADDPTGPQVPVGSTITWDYVVTNLGNVGLTNVILTDDNGSPGNPGDNFNPTFISGNIDGDDSLDVSETWIYQATGSASSGQYENVAEVVGQDPGSNNVTDDDTSHYFGYSMGIHIEKATNGEDADSPTGPAIPFGNPVTWTYVVTNIGAVPLGDVQVIDDHSLILTFSGNDANSNDSIDVSETWTYEANGTAAWGQYANLGSVQGTDWQGYVATDDDSSHYIGYYTGSIGDYVWIDKNEDGIQDLDESGIPDVELWLIQGKDTLQTDTTNASGIYNFTNLPLGTYIVEVNEASLPADFYLTTHNEPDTVDLAMGEDYNDADFGYRPEGGSIGDYVWHDADGEGDQDPDEKGIPNVKVILRNASWVIVGIIQTNSNGYYRFNNLYPGIYRVEVDETTLPEGYFRTSAEGRYSIDLGPAEIVSYADFGYRGLLGSIGDYVWNDADGEGDQDETNAGIPDVVLKLILGNTVIKTDTTDANGAYDFTELEAGLYVVDVEDSTIPDWYILTTNNEPDTVLLAIGEDYNDADFGYRLKSTGSIGDYVWEDKDRDGDQDTDEIGLPEITVGLFDTLGTLLLLDSTDVDGMYLFEELEPGVYIVDVYAADDDMPWNYVCTTNNDPMRVELIQGQDFLDADFGFMAADSGVIGNYTWHDKNWDANQDPFETPLSTVKVFLLFNKVLVDSLQTDGFGLYYFTHLPPGEFDVKAHRYVQLPSGGYQITTVDSMHVSLAAGEVFLDADFGFAYPEENWGTGRRYLLARYQPWYADTESDSTLRHWIPDYSGGYADTSLFNRYDSYDPYIWEYHILAAWACGIDGFAVDWYGKDAYENPGMKGLLNEADILYQKYNIFGFNFEIAASYNEEAFGEMEPNFEYMGDSLMTHPAYWGTRRHVRRPLFLYNAEAPIYTPAEYSVCADTTLPSDVFLLWNGTEPECFDPVDVCYPWVQPLDGQWDPNGMEWGESYIDTTYSRENYLPDPGDLLFALGGVWPGFDDREWSLGEDHWMSRQDTLVYNLTWEKVHNYSHPLQMPWCLIETWNDFNQATEIEPSVDWDYKFNVLTRDHARRFKGSIPPDSVGVSNLGLLVPQHIHQARRAGDLRPDELTAISALINQALNDFFNKDHLKALSVADQAAGIAPNPITIESVEDTSVEISWEAATHANCYHIYYSVEQSHFEPCSFIKPDMVSIGNVTSYVLTGLMQNTDYWVAVTAADTALGLYANDSWYENTITGAEIRTFKTIGTSSVENVSGIPKKFALNYNYPNPFNPITTIQYDLPITQHVALILFDMRGREVRKLVDEVQKAGVYTIQLDAGTFPSGIYFYRLVTEKFTKVRKMMLLK